MRIPKRWPAVLALLCLSVTAFVARAEPESAPIRSDFVIGVSDRLQIQVWQEPELSMPVLVRPDGKIGVPLAGELLAEGKTPTQLSEEITEALSRYLKEPIVTVIVAEINHFSVYVVGEVNGQGVYHLTQRTQLLQLIAVAGGLTQFSKGKIVVIRREEGRERRVDVDYRKIMNGERPEQNIFVRPGDTILVY